MPLYEHVFITRQDVSNQQVETLTSDFSKVIEEGGGKIARSEYWGLRPLAYKIKKNRKAHYSMLNIDSPHEAVAEMERLMSLSTDILRFLTVRVDEHEEEPSVMMRKNERDDRRGGRGDRPPFNRDRNGPGGRPGGDRKFDGPPRSPAPTPAPAAAKTEDKPAPAAASAAAPAAAPVAEAPAEKKETD